MRTTVAVLDKRGGNAASKVASALVKSVPDGNADFELANPSRIVTAEHANDLCAQKMASSAAAGSVSMALEHGNVQMFKVEDGAVAFEGRLYVPKHKGSAAEFIVAKIRCLSEEAAEAFLKDVEGDFSLILVQDEKLIAARDPVGVQPLYYGETEEVAAIASNRRTLWGLGISEPKSFPTGHVGSITEKGFEFKRVQALTFNEPKTITMDKAAKTVGTLLERSVKRRVFDLKEVAVAFSGGLDSSIIAHQAHKAGVNVNLIHVSLPSQPETEEARKAADLLGLPLQVHLFTEADLEKAAPKVVELIEEPDPVKVSVGVPFYWTAQKAAEVGYRVMLAGQGADELFGGYQRYVTEYLARGDEAVRETMFRDVAVIHESNIERDEKICGYFDVELRLPFASMELAEFAMSLPTELKFENKSDSLRKLVLRKAAENLGLPNEIAEKPKKAVQYSTGTSSALKKLAKRRNLTLGEYAEKLFLASKHKHKT